MARPTNALVSSLAGILLAAGAHATAQDLTIVSKVTTDKNPPKTATSYLSRDHLRISQAEGSESILDLKTGEITTLEGKNKTYYVTTRQDLEEMAAKMKERMNSPEMKKAQEQMKNLPPEQRKKMESMMGGMSGAFDVRKTGTARRIAGYPCENWTITFGELSRTEECLSTELQLPAQAWDMYRDYAASMKSMMASIGPIAKGMEEMQEKFKNLKGYPLATTTSTNIMGRSSVTTSEVVDIKRGPIPASAWEIPAGYGKVDNPMRKAFRSHK
jgi:hypothetical protein